jgi:uncharacterized protein YwgA
MALVEILACIEQEPYHWPIGRIIFQKIAYFATMAGIPTGLEYQRGSFGPYAPRLKGIVTRLTNNNLISERRLGRMFAVGVGPTYGSARQAYEAQLARWRDAVVRIADLFMRIRETQQAELAATVHFAAIDLARRKGVKPTEHEVMAEVLNWKRRKRPPVGEEEVGLTIRNLAMLSWLDVEISPDLPVAEEVLLGL